MRSIIDIVAPIRVRVQIVLMATARLEVLLAYLNPVTILDCSPILLARVQRFSTHEVSSLLECQHAPTHLLDVSF